MDIDDILPRLLVDAPECPSITAQIALVDAARELCSRGLAWIVALDPIYLIDNISEYDIESPNDGEPVMVRQVWTQHGPLHGRTMDQITEQPGWREARGSLPTTFNNGPDPAVLLVLPTPLNANREPLYARAAFRPTLSATTLDNTLVSQHLDALLKGARSRLFLQPRKPWTDAKLGLLNGEQFEADLVDARIRALRDNTRGSVTWTPRGY